MTDPSGDSAARDETAPRRAEARRAAENAASQHEPVQPEPSSFHEHVKARRDEFEQQIDRARADFEQVNERINERTGRNLLMAILIGVAIGAVVLATLLFVKWLFLLFAIPVALLGVFEFSRALQTAGRRVDIVPQLIVGAVIALVAFFQGHWTHWVVTIACVVVVIVWRMLGQMAARDGRRYGDVLSDILVAGFIPIYVPFLASMTLVLLRQDQGEYWVLGMIIVVVAADTGAYASGLAFGSHPMAPRISPNKTWEGFAGGAVATTVVAILYGMFVLHVPWWAGAIFGLVLLGSATAGDLGESMIKRDLGIKDMSSWLPGHGGVLDRLDSILPSAAAALAMYFLFFPLVSV
ncbi:MAG: phosphatidate cytidylyltransferase [Microbacterium sp. SCN 70-200]|uniref:phosphatidate cytidylyltransferase n=1 Tax=unclassified Microbacterium TaxID=2609290 RepID=UPI00086AFBCB|nr:MULTISPECIES: phosphatidate cytidylyltransferase [unclassified Microbacterium]MBN9214522.1 phosphatidate cytidylyltransferase [Microbacterium sp.]ODT41418.1 MAG: phosphatidate cytidylyltransferase [Microbacterium sp. SCN 70-200]OJV84101.1 MAG: phosphatidate cytidylyltransferase [Microbacterium sp. 70-16]